VKWSVPVRAWSAQSQQQCRSPGPWNWSASGCTPFGISPPRIYKGLEVFRLKNKYNFYYFSGIINVT